MGFIGAIQHATIGYGVRRPAWHPDFVLWLDRNTNELKLVNDKARDGEPVKEGVVINILGGSKAMDLDEEDLTANDWETI